MSWFDAAGICSLGGGGGGRLDPVGEATEAQGPISRGGSRGGFSWRDGSP